MISDHVARLIRAIASPVLRSNDPDATEIAVDKTTNTLVFLSNGQKVAVDASNTQTIAGNKTLTGTTTLSGTTNLSGAVAFTGATTGVRRAASITSADTISPAAADSGTVYIFTKSSATQVLTLPAAATAGLEYTFVCGHASGEINVGVATGDNIVGKTHGAENGTGLSSTATTGLLKNTAASNVVGDFTTLVSDGATTWYMVAVAGVWSVT